METVIRLKTNEDGIFEPDRIGGNREDLEAHGIEILGKESEDSGWGFECVDVRVPDKEFTVNLDGFYCNVDNKYVDCGDLIFDNFCFGYVEYPKDFEIISGYNPFKKEATNESS